MSPVRQDHPALAQFCEELRQLWVDSGEPKFETMAALAGVTKGTISRATSGRFPPAPSWTSIAAWIHGCGRDSTAWHPRYVALIAELKTDARAHTAIVHDGADHGSQGERPASGWKFGERHLPAQSAPKLELVHLLGGCVATAFDLALTLRGGIRTRSVAGLPSHDAIVRDLRLLRERGLIRLRILNLPALRQVASGIPGMINDPLSVEIVLRDAVRALGDEELGRATAYLFGLVQGTVGRRPTDLRERAAIEYGRISPETFRKGPERLLIGRLADEILREAARSFARAEVGEAQVIDRAVLERVALELTLVPDLEHALALARGIGLDLDLRRALDLAHEVNRELDLVLYASQERYSSRERALTIRSAELSGVRARAINLGRVLARARVGSDGAYVFGSDGYSQLFESIGDNADHLNQARDTARRMA